MEIRVLSGSRIEAPAIGCYETAAYYTGPAVPMIFQPEYLMGTESSGYCERTPPSLYNPHFPIR